MSRHNFGTAIRRDINAQMLGKALAAPGMDQRYWCSLGTVCTIDPESGKMDPTDKLAIYNDSAAVLTLLYGTGPVITHIMQSRSKRQPTENGKPIFDNNRLLVYAKNVPIDIRTAGGAQILIEQDGTVTVEGKAIKLGDALPNLTIVSLACWNQSLASW